MASADSGGSSCVFPDYQGGSVVNLMSSVMSGFGCRSAYAGVPELPAGELREARSVVLLVIDGLGHDYLLRYAPDGFLASHVRRSITSVWPATTASAVTTFLSGQPPCRHGATGWFMYLREIGAVAAILPYVMRAGNMPLGPVIGAGTVLRSPSIFDRLSATGHHVTRADLAQSEYTTFMSGHARRHGYNTMEQCFSRVQQLAQKARKRTFIHAYWPELDSIGHHFGMHSDRAHAHLARLDRAVERLWTALRARGVVLLVTADHGQVDVRPHERLKPADHPRFEDCLRLPLCGEPRMVYCYVKPNKTGTFETYVRKHFNSVCWLWDSQDMVRRGCFGPGKPDSRFVDRIGDYVLVMKGHYILRDTIAGEGEFVLIGNHGGASRDEMVVPLCVCRD